MAQSVFYAGRMAQETRFFGVFLTRDLAARIEHEAQRFDLAKSEIARRALAIGLDELEVRDGLPPVKVAPAPSAPAARP